MPGDRSSLPKAPDPPLAPLQNGRIAILAGRPWIGAVRQRLRARPGASTPSDCVTGRRSADPRALDQIAGGVALGDLDRERDRHDRAAIVVGHALALSGPATTVASAVAVSCVKPKTRLKVVSTVREPVARTPSAPVGIGPGPDRDRDAERRPEVVRVFGGPAGELVGDGARRHRVVDRLVRPRPVAPPMYSAMTTVPAVAARVGAVLRDALLGEQRRRRRSRGRPSRRSPRARARR